MTDARSAELRLPTPAREPDRRLLEDVRTHGWHVIRVSSEDHSTGWAFSVGLFYTFRHPEIVIFGRTTEIMHTALDTIGRDIKAGHRFEDRAECDGLLEGARCTFRSVQRKWYEAFLGYGLWFYDGTRFPALQCFWPDRSERYPWEAGFRSDWAELQPLLFHDAAEQAGVLPWLQSMGVDGQA